MKSLKNIFFAVTLFMLFGVSHSWGGAEGLFLVYQIETSDVNGELNLRPVEIQFDMSGDTNPTYGVFAEWLRPYVHDTNQINLEQRNKAYCKGMKVDIKHNNREHIDVFLDYSDCNGGNKPRSAKDKLFEGIAAAIFYTENVPKIKPVTTLNLHIKGISKSEEITEKYSWDVLQNKWHPWWGGFIFNCK